MKKRIISFFLLLTMAFSLLPASAAERSPRLDEVTEDTARCLLDLVPAPQVGSIGGEWAVLGLARSGSAVPDEYYRNYYDTLCRYVSDCGGVLHERKYTEYSRVILALSALGLDGTDVAGYDLTAPLLDREQTVCQGVNGPIYTLLALDSRTDSVPTATQQWYVDYILSCQLPEGGWSLSGQAADPDLTGMALQALAKYQEQPAAAQAIQRALSILSARQSSDGGFSSIGRANVESCAQVIVALCELGLSLDDPRFVKDGHTLLDGLLEYYEPGKGFRHTPDEPTINLMATEQAFYALAALAGWIIAAVLRTIFGWISK